MHEDIKNPIRLHAMTICTGQLFIGWYLFECEHSDLHTHTLTHTHTHTQTRKTHTHTRTHIERQTAGQVLHIS
jgi:hypothetical protein